MKEFTDLNGLWERDTAVAYIKGLLETGGEVYVVVVDIDFFANINAKIGKNSGDKILKKIGEFFSRIDGAWAGRYGGDEFIIIYKERTAGEVSQLVDSLRVAFRKEKFIGEDSIYAKVPITASFGIASGKGSGDNVFLLLKKAEIALAMAKKRGRNRVVKAPEGNIKIINNSSAAVTTVAGGWLRGDCNDGVAAFAAGISEPYGLDVTKKGEVLIADRGNHKIRIIKKDGTVHTLAGQGTCGYSGDGGPARIAEMNKPSGIAVDSEGRLYIADTGNNCIRKIDTDGIISTLAGCEKNKYRIDGTPVVDAMLSRPGGVAVDGAGNVYTNDYGNNVIKMINCEGIIQTIAGSGDFGYEGDGGEPLMASFDRPYGLTVSDDGYRIYVADYGNHCIREINRSENRIRTVCGNGEPGHTGDEGDARKVRLNGPFWVSLWMDRYLFIADGNNNCIRMYDLYTSVIQTIAGGTGPGYIDGNISDKQIKFNIPAGTVVDENRDYLYVADYGNNAVRRIVLKKLDSEV